MAEKINLCVGGVIRCNGLILIVKRASTDDFLPNVWEFPGGTVEKNELVSAALIRELKEEINVDVSQNKFRQIGVVESFNDNFERFIQINYEIYLPQKPCISLSMEHSAFDWVRADDERLDPFLKSILKLSHTFWQNHR